MIKGISRDLIRSFLDKMGISSRVDNEGDLFMVLSADEQFDHDVVVFFLVKDDSLGVYAFASDYKVPEDKMLDAIVAVNQYNATRKYPKVYIKDNVIQCEYWFLLDEEVSEEYIVQNCLRMLIQLCWQFFVDFKY